MESIEIEWIQRDGRRPDVCNVHVCRTATRGKHANIVWKDLTLVKGEFEKWSKRWNQEMRKTLERQVVSLMETRHEEYMTGKEVKLVPDIKKPSDLLRSLRGA